VQEELRRTQNHDDKDENETAEEDEDDTATEAEAEAEGEAEKEHQEDAQGSGAANGETQESRHLPRGSDGGASATGRTPSAQVLSAETPVTMSWRNSMYKGDFLLRRLFSFSMIQAKYGELAVRPILVGEVTPLWGLEKAHSVRSERTKQCRSISLPQHVEGWRLARQGVHHHRSQHRHWQGDRSRHGISR
jgi:hypothetical protein